MRVTTMEALCCEVSGALTAADVPHLVLKGPSIAQWLYNDGVSRPYSDIDVLVHPDGTHPAADALLSLGFVPPAPAYTEDVPVHAHAWHRRRDEAWVDLHYTLAGVGVSPRELWNEVWGSRVLILVDGVEVATLGEGARAMHLALHVAQDHLGRNKKLEDLRRAVEGLAPGLWHEAAEVATRLQAAPSMGIGLRQLPQGAALADELGLSRALDPALLLRASGGPLGADAFAWMAQRQGSWGKLRYAVAKIFPPPWFIRSWSPLPSRYGVLGLILAYAHRLAWVLRRTPAAGLAWVRARRHARGSSDLAA